MDKKKLAYSIGTYLGEYIIHKHMPSISCNQWTNNVIQVTWGEAQEYRRLEEVHYLKVKKETERLTKGIVDKSERYKKEIEARELCKKEWNESIKYGYMLNEKYLPHILKMPVPFIDLSDDEFSSDVKKSLIDFLWETDFCDYSIDDKDVLFEDYEGIYTLITLKLQLNPPSSYSGEDWIEIKTIQKNEN